MVLNAVSFSVPGGSKVGICGRTGAGKSSIMVGLFRMVELAAGKLVVDGIDISTLGLQTLRKSIVIMPQVRRPLHQMLVSLGYGCGFVLLVGSCVFFQKHFGLFLRTAPFLC